MLHRVTAPLLALLVIATVSAAPKSKGGKRGPEPTFADVQYGPAERNVLDFWKADGEGPRPVVVFIHGGGFINGDKSQGRGSDVQKQCLSHGVSYAAINYRFRTTAPVQDILRDCARAIQFMRSKAAVFNVDKSRIGAYGGSAGAGTSLWLAFHPDLADAGNADPVLRESSRISVAGATACQCTYDLLRWPELLGDSMKRFAIPGEVSSFYGFKSDADLETEAGKKVRADCDMLGLITKNGSPVYLLSTQPDGEIQNRNHMVHHPKHAQLVKQKCDEAGVEAVLVLPNVKGGNESNVTLSEFLLSHLGVRNGGE
jgi:hypothetical protein